MSILLDKLKEWIKWFLLKISMDRAVFFFFLGRVVSLLAGPVTILIIATYFSPEIQGYYYTFLSLLSLQVMVELGFGYVLLQFVSHEWSLLRLDNDGKITGDPKALSRLVGICDFGFKWYLAIGLVVAIGLGIGGCWFFGKAPNSIILPWITLSFLTGIMVFLVFIWSVLEGCNQVVSLYSYRVIQTATTNLVLWAAILLGARLWAISLSTLASIICGIIFLRYRYWNFFKGLFFPRIEEVSISWWNDIFPMQWRFALSGISGYFAFFVFTPVLFHYHGPVLAGQFGMSWNVVGVMGALSYAWLAPRIPQFGILIAQKNYKELDRLFFKIVKMTLLITVLLAGMLWALAFFINLSIPWLANRLLPMFPLTILLLAQILVVISVPFPAYLRAHKKEPLLVFSLFYGLAIGLLIFILGKYFMAVGVVLGYLIINVIFIPVNIYIWYRCRKKWHKGEE